MKKDLQFHVSSIAIVFSEYYSDDSELDYSTFSALLTIIDKNQIVEVRNSAQKWQ